MKNYRGHTCVLPAFTVLLLFWHSSTQAQTGPAKPQQALASGEEIFRRLSPSVFVVESLDENGSVVVLGSGVAVGPSQVVTNTHVIDSGVRIRIRQREETWLAEIDHISLHTDLCRLRVDGLHAPPVPLRPSKTLAAGEQVYAIGAPEGLELSISGGLISAIRELNGEEVIQTTAAISHGSSGGGLFDRDGKLVGVTTFMLSEGQNLNFALPVDSALEPETPHDSDLIWRHAYAGLSYDEAVQKFGKDKIDQDLKDVRLCEEVLKKNPNDSKAHGIIGDRMLGLDFHRALRELREAVRLKPDVDEVRFDLGAALDAVGDPHGSVRELREAERLDPSEPGTHLRLAEVLLECDDTKGALSEVKEVARVKRQWLIVAFFFVPLAQAMAQDGDISSATAVCAELKNSEDPSAAANSHYCLGVAVLSEKPPETDRAVSELREAIQMDGKEYDYHHALAQALEMAGQHDKAVDEYRRAYELYPNGANLKADYEKALSEQNERERPK